jgi:Sep-tRNA:Cys-tRNA synthetase
MTGGLVPDEVQRRLFEEGWIKIGYSLCFNCMKGRSGLIKAKPPVGDFLDEVAELFEADKAEHTYGCRVAQFAAMKAVANYLKNGGSTDHARVVVADSLYHYTTAIAAELNDFQLAEVPHGGHPDYKIDAEAFAQKIETVKSRTGKLPALILATHVEPFNGNMAPIEDVGKIAREYDVPYAVNVAYTAGVMPVSLKRSQADFFTLSAHKSMASLGPMGFLLTNSDWAKRAFRESSIKPDWSGRVFTNKFPNIFGCSVGGIPVITAMYSLPFVMERMERWGEELEKVQWFIDELEKIEGIELLGEKPHKHHLLHFETPLFWEISKRHKRKGFFLAEEMGKRRIVGLQRGLAKHIKLSVYGLSWDEVKRVRDAFYEVAERYVRELKLDYKVP